MRRRKNELEEDVISRQAREDQGEELSEKDLKKKKREEGKERRKKAKKMDKVERWSGMILLGMILLIGFLLWVAGEMRF